MSDLVRQPKPTLRQGSVRITDPEPEIEQEIHKCGFVDCAWAGNLYRMDSPGRGVEYAYLCTGHVQMFQRA